MKAPQKYEKPSGIPRNKYKGDHPFCRTGGGDEMPKVQHNQYSLLPIEGKANILSDGVARVHGPNSRTIQSRWPILIPAATPANDDG